MRRLVGAGDGHGDDVARQPAEGGQKSAGVLQAHHADDKMQRLGRPLLEVGHGLRQRPPGRGVMAAVEPQLGARFEQRRQRAGIEPVHACRPAHRRQSLLDGLLVDTKLRQIGGQPQGSGDGGARVDHLMAADEARQRQVEQQFLQLHHETAALLVGVELLAPHDQRRAKTQRLGTDDVLGLRLLLRNNGRHPSAQNAGFLGRDLRQRGAELLGMVERDGRDDVEHRAVDDVGRIEAAAEADLEQQHVGGVLGKGKEGGRRGDLELGDVVAAVGGLCARQYIDQRLFTDRCRPAARAGKLDTLVKAHEMRRRIDVHARAGGFDDRFQVGGDGALAVGAGNVHDRRQLLVRIAQLAEQPLDTAERQVDQLRVQQLHLGEELGARRHAALPPLGSVRTDRLGKRLAPADRGPRGTPRWNCGGHQCCLSLGSERVDGGVSSSPRGLSRCSWCVASKRCSGARISASIGWPEPLRVSISLASTGLPLA